MQTPCETHMQTTLKLLRYLKGTVHHGLVYPAHGNMRLHGYCDSDWGGCQVTRRSLTGYCIFFWECINIMENKKAGSC